MTYLLQRFDFFTDVMLIYEMPWLFNGKYIFKVLSKSCRLANELIIWFL